MADETAAGWRRSPPRSRAGTYPAEEHTYPISDEEFALFESEVAPGVLAGDDVGSDPPSWRRKRVGGHGAPPTLRIPGRP